jgi:hypothetical protein
MPADERWLVLAQSTTLPEKQLARLKQLEPATGSGVPVVPKEFVEQPRVLRISPLQLGELLCLRRPFKIEQSVQERAQLGELRGG